MNTALVIVDMLRDFVGGRLANPAARPTIARIGELAEAARGRKDWIVVYGNDAHQPGDVELRLFGEHAMVGTPGAEVINELAPAVGDIVVPKRYYSAFTQTDLEATCLVHDVGRVVIAGSIPTAACGTPPTTPTCAAWRWSCRPMRPPSFQPLSEEAVQARQQRALDYLRTFYGVSVVPTAELLG